MRRQGMLKAAKSRGWPSVQLLRHWSNAKAGADWSSGSFLLSADECCGDLNGSLPRVQWPLPARRDVGSGSNSVLASATPVYELILMKGTIIGKEHDGNTCSGWTRSVAISIGLPHDEVADAGTLPGHFEPRAGARTVSTWSRSIVEAHAVH